MISKFFAERQFNFVGDIRYRRGDPTDRVRANYILQMKYQYKRFGALHAIWDDIRNGVQDESIVLTQETGGILIQKNMFSPYSSKTVSITINGQDLYELIALHTRGEVHMDALIEFSSNGPQQISKNFVLRIRFQIPSDAVMFKLVS